MKINVVHNLSFSGSSKQTEAKDNNQQAPSKTVDTDALSCQSSYNVAMLNHKSTQENLLDNAIEFCKKIANPNENIGREHIQNNKGETIAILKLGKPIEGWKDLYDYDTSVSCYFDEKGNVKQAFKYNSKTKEIFVYDNNGKQTHYFTKEDREALHYYKYHPDSIHSRLRDNRDYWSGDFLDETIEMANRLAELFENDTKIFKTNEDITVYRALQKNLTEEQITALSTIGGIYTDPSFCSTTEDLNTAKSFSCENPILKISLPKGSKYMDVERLFNIDRIHWSEKELLLNKNSHFVVTGHDTENNIVEVSYLG